MELTRFTSRVDLSASRVDRENNIIKGVRLISLGTAKGHKKQVDLTTLKQIRDCAKKYQGGLRVRFNPTTFNHGDGGLAGRLPADSIKLNEDEDAVVGDLHVYKSYAHKDYLYEIAETAPDNIGLSVEFSGVPEEIDKNKFARCEEIFAATIVDLPAANPTGLFSEKPYGDVTYADPGYQKDGKARYPIDTAAHARAAWSYINQGDNASAYSPEDLTKVKNKIKSACEKFGIEISEKTNASMELTTENLTAIGKACADGLKPVFENMFRQKQNEPGEPTADELVAAGVTDDDTEEQKKSKVTAFRATADQPVTVGTLRRSLMEVFRFSGGKPARASGDVTEDDNKAKGQGTKFETLVHKFRATGMSEEKVILRAREDDPEGFNKWSEAGRPEIVEKKTK